MGVSLFTLDVFNQFTAINWKSEASKRTGDPASLKQKIERIRRDVLTMPPISKPDRGWFVPKASRALFDIAEASYFLDDDATLRDGVNVALFFGADINARMKAGKATPLFYAHGYAFAALLLTKGADPNARNVYGETPLHCLQYMQLYTKAADALMRFGADIFAVDNAGDTPLHTAARVRSDIIVDYLIQRNRGTVLRTNKQGRTPLFHAVYHRTRTPRMKNRIYAFGDEDDAPSDLFSVEYMIKAGANVNHTDKDGRTPLHFAAQRGDENITAELLSAGADEYIRDRFGRTPFQYKPRVETNMRSVKNGVSRWTTTTGYQGVRRTREGSAQWSLENRRINASLALFLRSKAPRMPDIPEGVERPAYLYRGVHGPEAAQYRRNGYLDSKSYVATSRSKSIAEAFSNKSNNGIVLKIPFESIPPGTPMVWFSESCRRKNRMVDSFCASEKEVLLPPGRVTILRHENSNGHDAYLAQYEPDTRATSVYKSLPLVRRLEKPRLNSNNTTPLPAWLQTHRLLDTRVCQKACGRGKICNPATGRCVKKTGIKGRQLAASKALP